ncbi:MAG: hypothetical protein LBM77_09720 [Spirochaetaceae bacterium]|jgi:hypothetical protein|nr:hypothetical protein [Spirochaetaceae bacterium]
MEIIIGDDEEEGQGTQGQQGRQADAAFTKLKRSPNCFKCKYFHITWDVDKPHGCEFFSFKTAGLPALEVKTATGSFCPMFREK